MTDVVERSTYLVLLSGNIQKCPECSCGLDTAEETKDGPPKKAHSHLPIVFVWACELRNLVIGNSRRNWGGKLDCQQLIGSSLAPFSPTRWKR